VGKITNYFIGWTCNKHWKEKECMKSLSRKALKKEGKCLGNSDVDGKIMLKFV
jgi:hypothetical protein